MTHNLSHTFRLDMQIRHLYKYVCFWCNIASCFHRYRRYSLHFHRKSDRFRRIWIHSGLVDAFYRNHKSFDLHYKSASENKSTDRSATLSSHVSTNRCSYRDSDQKLSVQNLYCSLETKYETVFGLYIFELFPSLKWSASRQNWSHFEYRQG